MRTIVRAMLLGMSIAALPSVAFAQSSITGVVRDTTGAVLPGATVEAASPALIEKVRTVVTDGQGVYRIVDLRPGSYVVTFTLTGFNTVRRDGIELPASFTATVNAELRVGALEETVTVSGQAPLLDTQSVNTRQVLSSEVMNTLPTNRTPQSLMMAITGVTGPFPGASDRDTKQIAVHGNRPQEATVAYDGFSPNLALGPGGYYDVHYVNLANIEELTVQTGGGSAEQMWSGIQTEIVPKEGGNTFSGFFYGSYSGAGLQSDNLRDEWRARGLNTANSYKRLWDINPGFGGRIVRDKLWFYSSVRNTGSITYVPYLSYAKDPKAWKYEKDESRKGDLPSEYPDMSTRLTWQATPKNKISAFFDLQPHHVDHRAPPTNTAITSIEATNYLTFFPNAVAQVMWRSAVTNRLLVEAGGMANYVAWTMRRQSGIGFDTIPAQESTLNLNYRAAWPLGNDRYFDSNDHAYTVRASASYVTGAHAIKTGVMIRKGTVIDHSEPNGELYHGVALRNFAPISVTQVALPDRTENHINADDGVFVQDRWTIARLTLNLGVRYDYFNAMAVAQRLAAGPLTPARDLAEVRDVPNFHDLSPRLGVAYDLFGNGKTALKATLNRYVAGVGTTIAGQNNPVTTSVRSVSRTFRDDNNNFIPDCDLKNPLVNGECGQISNLNFGLANPLATQYDDEVLRGFGKRGYNWETSVAVQRQLVSGLVMDVGYFRRWYGNQLVTDNLEVTSADYDAYCLTVPVDPRLPGGGGNQLCGFADIQRAKFGRFQNFVTFAKNFGTQTEIYNGVDVTMSARFPGGTQLSGGLNTGRTATNNCFVVDSPQQLQYCDEAPPFQTQYKLMGVYRLPWGLETSAVFQSIPPRPVRATYVATNAEIRPTLLRDLASGPNGTATVNLVGPSEIFLERFNQLDFRLSRVFSVNKARLTASIDAFNLFNSSATQLVNARFGPSWLLPTQSQVGRYVQFSTQLRF